MTTDTVGGVWSYTMTLASQLSDADVEVHVVTSGPAPSAAQRAEAVQIPNLHVHPVKCRLEWMDQPWDDVARWLIELQRIVSNVQPDIVHCNAYAPAARTWEQPTVLVAHSCVGTWWRGVHGERPPARFDRYLQTVSEALMRADRVVAPTRAFAAMLRSFYNIGRCINVIHNGAEHYRIGRKRDIVLCAGRLWDEAKNLQVLADASPRIPCPVLAAGDGGAKGRTSTVRWLGLLDQDRMQRYMAEAAVFVHPARYEPFGLAVLEAAANGCALVLGDIPTLRELWDGAAAFVNPNDADALAWQINALRTNTARREAMASAAIRRAACYSSRAMAQSYLRLYRSMLAVEASQHVRMRTQETAPLTVRS